MNTKILALDTETEATDNQDGGACSTALRFTEAPCLSTDGQSCVDFVHPDVSYQAIVNLKNFGDSPSCSYTVKFQIEPDGFFTQESEFASFEVISEQAVLAAGEQTNVAADLGKVLPKGIHFNLKAWIYMGDTPLCNSDTDTCLQEGTYTEHKDMQVEDTTADATNSVTAEPDATNSDATNSDISEPDVQATPTGDAPAGDDTQAPEGSTDNPIDNSVDNPAPLDTVPPAIADFEVSGIVPAVAQPTNMTCWAASATMMVSWRDQASYSIETVMDDIGSNYRQKFDNNEGLFPDEEEAFFAALGMRTEPPQSYALEGILSLLQNFGPIFTIGNEGSTNSPMVHARIISGIFDTDGTLDGIQVQVNDPNGGRQYRESLRSFSEKYEDVAIVDMNGGFELRLQIAHF